MHSTHVNPLFRSPHRLPFPAAICFVGSIDSAPIFREALRLAAKCLYGGEGAGETVASGNLVYFTVLQVKTGTRSTGSMLIESLPLASASLTDSLAAFEMFCVTHPGEQGSPMPKWMEAEVLNDNTNAPAIRPVWVTRPIHQFSGTPILLEVRRSAGWLNQCATIR
ncbi:MAG: hypothetical protein JWQ71_3672 [Pedosphaera sp.]|nr:hypothetical protein [Pedosphaera sp.]